MCNIAVKYVSPGGMVEAINIKISAIRVVKRTALLTIQLMSSDNEHASSQEIILKIQRALHVTSVFTLITKEPNII